MKQYFHKKDLFWILAFPVYQIIGTLRHEGLHVLVAWLQGVEILKFVFWPSMLEGRFTWGYVMWDGNVSWLAIIAPYFGDLIFFIVFFFVCTKINFKRHWIWINLVIMGMISPFINTLWGYVRLMWSDKGDVIMLLNQLPDYLVHVYFIGTIILFLIGIFIVLRPKSKTNKIV